MSISITLLGHSPKKRDGHSSGGDAGAGMTQFLHLAYANSEDGEGFTKTNINSEGHIAFFPYIGVCLSDDRDDESLSFNSYKWNNFGYGDASSQQSGTPSGSGNNGSGGNGSNGQDGSSSICKCDTCCNYKYCGGGNGDNVNPLTIISPQIVEYVKPECIYDGEMHETDQEYHLLFGEELSSIGYSLDKSNKDEGAQASVKWNLALKCQQRKIEVIAAYDFYQGWIYLADFYHGWSDSIRRIYTNLHDSLDDQGVYAKDGRWHYTTFETDPIMKFNSGTSATPTEYETMNDSGSLTGGTNPIGKAIAKWTGDNLLNTLFGEQKTIRIHECGISDTAYWYGGGHHNTPDKMSVYDCVIKYRWISTSFTELFAQLPKSYDIEYYDLNRHVDYILSGVTSEKTGLVFNNPVSNLGGGVEELAKTYYDFQKQGAQVHFIQPSYTGWQNDYETTQDPQGNTIYVRYSNGYDSTWLGTSTIIPNPNPANPNDNRTDAEIIEDNMYDAPDRIYDDTFGTIVKNYDLTTHLYCYTVVLNNDHYDLYDNGSTVNLLKFKDADNTFSITMNPNNDYSYTIKLLKPVDSYPNTITFSNQGQSDIVISKSYRDGDYLHPVYSMPDTYLSTFVYSPSHGKFIPGYPYNNQISQYVYANTHNLYLSRIYLDYNTNTKVDRGDENPVTYFDPYAKKIYNYRVNHRLYDYEDLTIAYDYSNDNSSLSDHYVTIT